MLDELLNDMRGEVNTCAAQQQRGRFIYSHTAPERTVLPNRVEAINHREDSGSDRNLLALQSVWITVSIPLFVMVADDRNYRIGKIHAAEHLGANHGVNLHLLEFRGRKSTGLIQNVRWYCKFADVVKQRTSLQRRYFIRRQLKHFSEAGSVDLHPANVAMRCLILCVDCGG